MSYFYFAGESSKSYGLKIISMPPPSRGGVETESITVPGRAEQLNKIKKEFKNTELEFEFLITDVSRTRDIFKWLKGTGKLLYSDEPDKYYNVISNEVIEAVRVSDELRSFTVKFICSPFAYSIENNAVAYSVPLSDSNPTASLTVGYGGTMYGEPLYKIGWAGRLEIKVNNTDSPLILDSGGTYTDEYAAAESGVAGCWFYECNQEEIYIDSSRKIAYKIENGVKKICCELTSGIYPFLDCGSNTFQFTLDKSVWDYNDRKYTRTGQKLTTFEVTKNERWL